MTSELAETSLVTRERVVAPPQRFISVPDSALLDFFKGEARPARPPQLPWGRQAPTNSARRALRTSPRT